jgi:15-cis-phytoene synthase
MDLYTKTSYELSKILTLRYSTSFSSSSKLFPKDVQPHIFAIYGLVRIGDEIVDTYDGAQKANKLTALEKETYAAIQDGYSANPIVHSFALSARQFGIDKDLIEPFFESMRMDLRPITYTDATYRKYIYGSAEVIGLMCLKVFTGGNQVQYKKLAAEASALGSAYQKVNFLRDLASDFKDRQRVYFPGVSFQTFDDTVKTEILKDIKKDFKKAKPGIDKLPTSAQKAVALSYAYYSELLKKLEVTPAATIKQSRVRVSDFKKAELLFRSTIKKARP